MCKGMELVRFRGGCIATHAVCPPRHALEVLYQAGEDKTISRFIYVRQCYLVSWLLNVGVYAHTYHFEHDTAGHNSALPVNIQVAGKL